MRLRKADRITITVALFVFCFALIFVQCIFVADGTANAQIAPYRELVSDYFSFNSPTRIAAGDGIVAVFDAGDVVILRNNTFTRFSVDATDCDKLCVSEDGVCILRGTGEEEDANPEILFYSLSGQKKDLLIPTAQVDDLCLDDGKIYTLSGYLKVTAYSAITGAEETSFNLPRGSLYLSVSSGVFYFRTVRGSVYRKTGTEYSENVSVGGDVDVFVATEDGLLYATGKTGTEVCRFGESSAFLTSEGSGDASFDCVTDFAADKDFVYVLDGNRRAIKVFDAGSGIYLKMIGSYGRDLKRLNAPVALAVKGGKILVADSRRVSEFSGASARALNGREIHSPRDVARTDGTVYLADNGVLYEYDSLLRYQKDYSIGASPCNYVTASPNGTVYAASGREVYQKKEGDSSFRKAITESAEINGLTVGIGGQVLYVLSGSAISAYTESGETVAFLETGLDVKGFSVDYRGDVYVVSGKKLYKYERRLEGYAAPATFDLPAAYASFSDVALGENGALYLIADHNVLIFEKEVFSVYTKEDAAFNDNEPSVHPRFVAEVTKDAAIAYVSPGNFEDISIIPKGKKLMCYATVLYQDAPYVRIETEKGTLYLAKSDVNVFEEGKAPFRQARCLLPAIGENVVGVNIYKEPSFIEIEKGTEPLFSSLGKEEVFEVLSVVAADEAGKDVWGFYRVSYLGTEGYVLADEVVSPDADPPPMPKTYEVQVKSDGLGKTVSVYSEEDKNSIVVGTLSDGTKIKALEPIDREKEFIKVLYQGEVCYVLSANLSQGGLTGGQVLAIVLSVVAAVGSVLTILILRASKKHKRNQ